MMSRIDDLDAVSFADRTDGPYAHLTYVSRREEFLGPSRGVMKSSISEFRTRVIF